MMCSYLLDRDPVALEQLRHLVTKQMSPDVCERTLDLIDLVATVPPEKLIDSNASKDFPEVMRALAEYSEYVQSDLIRHGDDLSEASRLGQHGVEFVLKELETRRNRS